MHDTTKAFLRLIHAHKLPVEIFEHLDIIRVPLNKRAVLVYNNNLNSMAICSNTKACWHLIVQNMIFQSIGLPVPEMLIFRRDVFTKELFDKTQISYPCCVKPGHLSPEKFEKISNVSSADKLLEYIYYLFEAYNQAVVIEPYIPNLRTYRIVLVNNKIVGMIEMVPPTLIGDGLSSITELIQQENKHREHLANYQHIFPIANGPILQENLKTLNVTNDHILKEGEHVILSHFDEVYYGATSKVGAMQKVHPQIADYIYRAAHEMNLVLIEVIVNCHDISAGLELNSPIYISVNHVPDIQMYDNPSIGKSANLCEKIFSAHVKKHYWSYLTCRFKHWLKCFRQ